jgi:hypothetical protein
MKRWLTATTFLAAVLSLACSRDSGPVAPRVSKIEVTLTPDTVERGASSVATAVVKDQYGNVFPDQSVTWSTTATTIASATSSGLILANSIGNTEVRATVDSVFGKATITVVTPTPATIAVSLDESAIAVGSSTQATAIVMDSRGDTIEGVPVEWSTLDSAIASVTTEGVVTGRADGVTLVRASVDTIFGLAEVASGNVPLARIDSVRPVVLKAGTSAMVYGVNFNPNPSLDTVSIDGVYGTVTAATANTVTFTVPDLGCVPAATRTLRVKGEYTTAVTNAKLAPKQEPLSLTVGQVAVRSGTDATCIQLPAGTATRDFTFVVANVNETPDLVTNRSDPEITLSYGISTRIGDATPLGGAGYDLVTGPSNVVALTELRSRLPGEFGVWAERRIRAAERRLDLPSGRNAHKARTRANVTVGVRAAVSIGDTLTLKVPSLDQPCEEFTTIKARVKYVSQHAVMLADVAAPDADDGGFADSDYQALGDEWDAKLFPTDTLYFGSPTDLDENDRVMILFTPEINKLTPKNSTSGFIGGFFFSGDLFPSSGTSGPVCTQSNEGEIFYLLTPDPAGTWSVAHQTESVREVTRGTIAHEFEHMINAGHKFTAPEATAFEEIWLDEALAHLAEDLTGRAVRGFGPLQQLTYADVRGNLGDYLGFFYQNTARLMGYLSRTDIYGATSVTADTSLSARGAGWSLLRYTADHFSSGTVSLFTRAVAYGPFTGVPNFVEKAGAPLDSILGGWTVALYADGLPITGLDPRYLFLSYNLRDVIAPLNAGAYPLVAFSLSGPGGGAITKQVLPASANYFRLREFNVSPARAIILKRVDGAPLNSAALRVLVLRTR